MGAVKPAKKEESFDPRKFLATIGEGRKVVHVSSGRIQFSSKAMPRMLSFTFRRVRSAFQLFPRAARKRRWEY